MDDKTKWNKKYIERIEKKEAGEANERLVNLLTTYKNGREALDVACGLGTNSMFLAKNGFKVHAVDISDVAIKELNRKISEEQLPIQGHVCDLTKANINLFSDSYDLIINTYYLDRSLFPLIKNLVKQNGYLFMETFFLSPCNTNKHISDTYKLHSQELIKEFSNWQILYFEEDEGEGRQTILVRKVQGA